MDAIGSSTKLMWFFVFIYSFPILLLILSVTIWSYKKFKRLAFISYIADTILTVLILLVDISNWVSRFIKGTHMYHLNLWNLLFLILSVIFITISIGYRCKNKKISNIFIKYYYIIVYFCLCYSNKHNKCVRMIKRISVCLYLVRSRNKAKPIRRRAVLDGTDTANSTMIQQRT